MKFYELMRAFFHKMVQMCSNFVTTCTIRGTQGAKLPADATFSGRSMVEMLGVLAIIGVLSVGAISGYSKAMMKYKLNKHTSQISELVANIVYTIFQKNYEKVQGGTDVAAVLDKLRLLPDGITYKSKNIIQTSLGISIELYVRGGENNLFFIIHYNKDHISVEACANTLQILKDYTTHTPSLQYVWLMSPTTYYYTAGTCSSSVTYCLPEMSYKDMLVACDNTFQAYVNGTGSVFYQWAQFDITK